MFGNPFFGRLSDRTSSRLGMRRPWMVIGLLGGSARHPRGRAGAQHRRSSSLGWCIAQLFFNALLAALVAVLPDQVPAAQRGLVVRRAGHLPAHRLGRRHLPRPAVHRQPAGHVPGPVRGRRVLHPAVRRHAEGSPAGRGGQAGLVAAGVRRHVLRQPAEEPGLRLGVRQPLPVRAGLRLPDHLPGLLPARQDRQRRGRRAAADLPRHARPVGRRRRRLPDRRPALRPDRPAEDLRAAPRRSSTGWRCS